MKRKGLKHTSVAVLISLSLVGMAQAETEIMGGKAVVTGEVTAGVQQSQVNGSEEKFQEYREVRDGVTLFDARIRVDSMTSPYYMDIKAKNMLQTDEKYSISGGVHGKYNFSLFYDSIPHNFSLGRSVLSDNGGGRLTISDSVQQQLEDPAIRVLRSERLQYDPATGAPLGTTNTAGAVFINPADAQNLALDAGMTGIVTNLYQDSANTIRYGLKREKTGFSLGFNIVNDVKVWAKVTNEKRIGNRVINSGTYERYNNGASGLPHIVDFFNVAGIELPEAIDYRTTSVSAGAGIYREHWLADVDYTFTNFRNRVDSLIWDNPFAFTAGTATGAGGTSVVPGTLGYPSTPANPFNRGFSNLGQLTLPPDSQSHDFSVSGSIDLPMHGKATGTISYGWINQDDAFEPITLNSAISLMPSPPGPGFDVTNTANLPQGNLDGEVVTLTQSYVVTLKPVDPVSVTAKYRYYDYDNKSDHILFPGYSAFGDSFWRLEKNDPNSAALDAPVENEALSFTRQNAELGVDVHVMGPLTVFAEGFWEDWDREELRIDGTTELGATGGFIFKPAPIFNVRGSYSFAHRTVDDYAPGNTAENPEAVGLQNYDWSDRERQRADLKIMIEPTEVVSLGLSGQYLRDSYGDENRFGLKRAENMAGGIDASYSPIEILTVYASYVRENRDSRMQSGAKDDAFNAPGSLDDFFASGPAATVNPYNYWNSDIKEKVDTVGFGATIQVIPTKLTLNTSYNLSYSRMDFNNSNPNAAAAQSASIDPAITAVSGLAANFASGTKLANALAQPWPTVRNRYHEIKADLGYNFTKNLKGGLTYLFEWYKLDDFAWDITQTYMAGISAENSSRYLFTDATYKEYEAHVGAVYVSYSF